MFFLSNEDETFVLNRNGVYTVGRSSGDVVIRHSSISRRHAEIRIENEKAYLRDCNSKYLSRYKGKILTVNEEVQLESSSEIVFGEVTFNFRMEPKIIICSTALKYRETELASVIEELGGVYLKDWNDKCTHLTSPEIIMTLKVLYALLDNKKIVLPEYWTAYLQNIKEKKLPPDPSEYVPPLGESILNPKYVEYNPDRCQLFNGKIFCFWKEKKLLKMQEIIKKCGGKSVLLNNNIETNKLLNLSDKYIIIEPEDSNIEEKFKKFFQSYNEKGKRLIPIQEIVFAILQCSCVENCNPSFNRVETVFSKNTQIAGPSRTIVKESESTSQVYSENQESRVIPCSYENNNLEDMITNRKNPFSIGSKKIETQNKIMAPAKRIKLDPDIVIVDKVTPVIDLSDTSSLQPSTSTSAAVPSSSKRPSDESISNPVKKFKEDCPSLKMNPFAIMNTKRENRNKDQQDSRTSERISRKYNPFLKENIKIENTDDVIVDENTSKQSNEITNSSVQRVSHESRLNMTNKNKRTNASVQRLSHESRLDVTNKNERTNASVQSLSNESRFDMTNKTCSGTWISCSTHEDIKPDLTLDAEERKWCEQFNNTVVIKVADLIKRTEENENISWSINSTSSNVKNFKKFRKNPVPKSRIVIRSRVAPALDDDNRDI